MPERRFELMGVPIDAVSMDEAVEWVDDLIRSGGTGQHAALNAGKLIRLEKDPELRKAISGCELVTADGQPVVWAARILGHRLPERVAGIDLMEALLVRAEACGHRVYLLGARPEALAAAELEIQRRHPAALIVGRHHGYFTGPEEFAVVDDIRTAKPDILFIALETPQKELFLARHRERFLVPFAMGVGGSFDVLAGFRSRAPVWARRAGLEWAFRLAQEPRRLWRRYFFGNLAFIALVGRELARTYRQRGVNA
jgi:N-acetylglucosaminyldiphosphoundecaprenol N-acetyl-beta-D-mannosaminyltransferase